jgi:hypothetical protein
MSTSYIGVCGIESKKSLDNMPFNEVGLASFACDNYSYPLQTDYSDYLMTCFLSLFLFARPFARSLGRSPNASHGFPHWVDYADQVPIRSEICRHFCGFEPLSFDHDRHYRGRTG